jgi:hypothetical protein
LIEKLAESLFSALVATTANELVPASDGVPETVPSVARLIPAGRLPLTSDQLYVPSPPVAAKLSL